MKYKIYKLKDLTSHISRGITPSYSDDDSGCVILNQKCIRNNSVSFDHVRHHDIQKKKVNEAKYVHTFDILINSTGVGTAGRVGQIGKVNNKITTDSHVTIVRPDLNKCMPKYLGYSLIDKQDYIASLAKGSTGQTEISRNSIENILIKLPDLETQKKVVRILSALDEKIELNNAQNRILFSFLKTDFRGKFNNSEKNDSCLMDYISRTVGGDWGKESLEGNNIIRVYCIRGADIPSMEYGDKGNAPVRYILEKNYKNKKLSPNNIIIEISGGSPTQSTGRTAYVTKDTLDMYDSPLLCTNFCRAIDVKSNM